MIYHVNIYLGEDWRKDRDPFGVGHWEVEIVPNFELNSDMDTWQNI